LVVLALATSLEMTGSEAMRQELHYPDRRFRLGGGYPGTILIGIG